MRTADVASILRNLARDCAKDAKADSRRAGEEGDDDLFFASFREAGFADGLRFAASLIERLESEELKLLFAKGKRR